MNKRIFSFLLVLTLLALAACGAPSTPSAATPEAASWQEQYDLGLRLLSEGNYEEAIIAFTAAIEIDAKRPEAYKFAAEAYVALEKIDVARAILEQGISQTGDTSLQEQLVTLEGQFETTPQPAENLITDDNQPKIQKIGSYDGNGVVQHYHEFTYRDDGKVDIGTSYDANGNQTGQVVYEYDADGKMLVGHFIYGILELGPGEKVQPFRYSYNADGLLIQASASDIELGTMTIYYDLNGKPSRAEGYSEDLGRSEMFCEYNAMGQIMSSSTSWPTYDETEYSVVFEYGSDGKLAGYNYSGPDGDLRTYGTCEYNEDGNVKRWNFYSYSGRLYEVLEYFYLGPNE